MFIGKKQYTLRYVFLYKKPETLRHILYPKKDVLSVTFIYTRIEFKAYSQA